MLLHRSCTLTKPAAAVRGVRACPIRPCVATIRASRAVARAAKVEVEEKPKAKVEEEVEFEDGPLPSTQQVETFLSKLCSDTDVAEVHVKMATFELKVRRSMSGAVGAAPIVAAAPAVALPAAPAAPAAEPVPMAAVPIAEASMDDTIDESLVVVAAPKVGVFRRGKYAAGKRVGKNNCVNVGDQVKKGQTVGFVEQLGTHVSVDAPIAGELVKFHVEDGAPVEYQQLVCEIAPFFGGKTGYLS